MLSYEKTEIRDFVKKEKLSSVPLNNEPFNLGDKVTFTNAQGVEFKNLRIIGFSNQIYKGSGTIYLNYDCYWFPTKANKITAE